MTHDEIVDVLCTYLSSQPPMEDEWSTEPACAELARQWARQLLTAANANGHGGCRLCGG
jgi:hypothetical protein